MPACLLRVSLCMVPRHEMMEVAVLTALTRRSLSSRKTWSMNLDDSSSTKVEVDMLAIDSGPAWETR